MKKLKLFTVLLIIAASLSTIMGCVDIPLDHEEIDPTRTQIYVANFNGGFGSEWIYRLKERFEKAFANESFEPGKTGVQIVITNGKDQINTSRLFDTISTDFNEVYFTEGGRIEDFIATGKLLDITDVVQGSLEEFGENKTIEEKLTEQQKQHLFQTGKYYAIPHYNGFMGLVYDVDLFNKKRLFFSKDGQLGKRNTDSDLSYGPDGIPNTMDDGLPATYEQFFYLCEQMKYEEGIIPISWTGEYRDIYTKYLLNALFFDAEGLDKGTLQFNAGTIPGKNVATLVKSINGQNIVTEEVEISPNNYNEIARQLGRYYAISFLERILDNGYFYNLSLNETQTHVMAQSDFLYSSFERNKKPIAMLIEGCWWENEAKNVFTDMVNTYGEEASRENRKFAFMPLPKPTEEYIGRKPVRYDGTGAYCFVNANVAAYKIDLIKKFIKFAHTDLSLQEFTLVTGTTKALNYTLTDEQYQILSYYSKTIWDTKSNSDIVYPIYPSVQIMQSVKDRGIISYSSLIEGYVDKSFITSRVVDALYYDKVSAKDYFNGIYKYVTR